MGKRHGKNKCLKGKRKAKGKGKTPVGTESASKAKPAFDVECWALQKELPQVPG
jgi:hypothetical protein